MKLFGSTHSAHCFVYVGHGIEQAHREQELAIPHLGFRGYHTLDRRHLARADLPPNPWVPHNNPPDNPPFVPQHPLNCRAIFSSPELAYRYAVESGTGRIRELELVIARSAKYSYKYAKNVLRGLFETGEEIILGDPYYAGLYAQYRLTGHFPADEEAIFTDHFYFDGDNQPNAAFHPFGFVEVLERDGELDDAHGARRLAILFLGAGVAAAYDAIFCQNDSPPVPFAIVLEDPCFGGNNNRFGQGGLLHTIAIQCNAIPRFLLVAQNTQAWNGFEEVPEVRGDHGGMHHNPRFLYRQRADA